MKKAGQFSVLRLGWRRTDGLRGNPMPQALRLRVCSEGVEVWCRRALSSLHRLRAPLVLEQTRVRKHRVLRAKPAGHARLRAGLRSGRLRPDTVSSKPNLFRHGSQAAARKYKTYSPQSASVPSGTRSRRYVNRKTTSRVGVAVSAHTERNVLVFLEELLDFFLRPIVECYFYVIQFYGDPSPIFILK